MNDPTHEVPFQSATIELVVAVAAPPERVWRALVEETTDWWPKDFYTGLSDGAEPRRFVIEPVLGGRMYEDWGEREGLVWATVIGVRRNRLLQLVGDSAPAWGGPNRGFYTFALEADGEGGTKLAFSEAHWGVVSEATRRSLEEGWRTLLDGALRGWIERAERPERPASISG